MAPITIKFSPSNAPIDIRGITAKSWFKTNFKNPNIDTKNSIGFDKDHLSSLINTQNCPELVISKVKVGTLKTLAIAGVGNNAISQFGDDNSVWVGNYFNFPEGTNPITLNFNLEIIDDPPNSKKWETPYSQSGSFDDVIKNYQEKPFKFNLNHFSTVNFKADKIVGLANMPNCSKIVFLPGYIYLTTRQPPASTDDLDVYSTIALETLVAVAVTGADKVIGDPVTAASGWPILYKFL